jgi:hypothetical protein
MVRYMRPGMVSTDPVLAYKLITCKRRHISILLSLSETVSNMSGLFVSHGDSV